MKNSFKIIKKIAELFLIFVLAVFVFTACMGTKKELYEVRNNTNGVSKIVDEKGNVILKTESFFEGTYVTLLNDASTKEARYIMKAITGDSKKTNTFEYDGQVDSYDYPSHRIELYDLEGKKVDINLDCIDYTDFVNGDYIYFYNYNTSTPCAYNVKTKEIKTFDYDNVRHYNGYVIMSNEIWGDKEKVVDIYDKNLKFIKRINGYTFGYDFDYEGKKYAQISTLSIITKDESVTLYNFIDDKLNVLYDKPTENYRLGLSDNMKKKLNEEKDKKRETIIENFRARDPNINWICEEKFDRYFVYDMWDIDYNICSNFTVYDENGKIIWSNVRDINIGMIDEYIVLNDLSGTKLIDKNLSVAKDYKRNLNISGWHSDISNYYSFTDNDTKLKGIMDKNFDIVLEGFKDVYDLEKDYFTFQNGFRYGLMRYNGKIICDFSIFDSANDEDKQSVDMYGDYVVPMENTDNKKGEYPRVDGSTANIPMMAQIRSDYLSEDLLTSENKVEVTTTDYAWRNLLNGNNDLLLVYEPSAETKKIIEESSVKLKVTPIGVDALVFITNEKNPINNLTTNELQDIYQGKITNWKELGGENKKIEAYQRPLNSGSQTLFLNLLMKDKVPMDAPKSYRMKGMDDLIEVIASYNDTANAIGYSVFYYAKKMYEVPGLKLLSVDSVEPNDDTIANGEYPYLNEYYLVIREDTPKDSETMKLYNFILSDRGRESIRKAGYIPK